MFQYIVKRLLLMLITLFGIMVITFVLTRLTPGEPAAVGQKATASSTVGYEDLIEQNRRMLGLDKPLIINLDFEDREYLAKRALHDFLRPSKFWQDDAAKRLRMASTIALKPALDMAERLRNVDGPIDHEFKPAKDFDKQVDVETSLGRLADLLPALAQHRPTHLQKASVEEKLAFWNTWNGENESRFAEDRVRQTVADYLDGKLPATEVLQLGGYAVPHLVAALDSQDDELVRRANDGLSGLTGFNFLSQPSAFQEEKPEIIQRWKTFYNRERVRFRDFNTAQKVLHILTNTQFGIWTAQVVKFDFGTSYKHKRSVTRLMLERIPVSIMLAGLSIFFSYLIAIPLGIFSAVKRGTGTDKLVTVVLFILYALPTFWVAQMLLLTLTGGPTPWGGEWPELFPTRGLNSEGLHWRAADPAAIKDLLLHLVLPVASLTYGSLAFLSRQMRSSMLDSISQDYVRTAEAKGLHPRTVIFKHVLRNSLIPILTLSATLLPELFAGSIIIESIFSIPGMGLLSFEAILYRDYPVVNAILVFSAALTLVGILLADLSYALADPRIKYE